MQYDNNTLRMWRNVFDPMLHLKVNFKEFCRSCRKINYHADCVRLFVEAKLVYNDDLHRHLEFHKRRRKLHHIHVQNKEV